MPQQYISASCILPSAPTPFILEPVNTIHKLFGGKGNPSSLLSMPVASCVATGTACGRLRSLLAREVFPFPPKPPIPSPGAFIGEESGIRDGFATKYKWRVYSLFILSIEIICKICVNRPWSIFSLKRCAIQNIRPVVLRKKRGFSVHFGPGCTVPPRVSPFSKEKRSREATDDVPPETQKTKRGQASRLMSEA